jgi:UDP-N-acetylglucosamine/UDP-N-acetylgalactosamine diphosphorylase
MMQDAIEKQRAIVQQFGQSHVFQFWSQLTLEQQSHLLSQIASIDFEELSRLWSGEEKSVDWKALANRAEPPDAIRLSQTNPRFRPTDALESGEQAIREGKLAMILVAGGQGTRLGFDLPKGMFRIGPVSQRTLFEMHADSLRGAMRRYGTSIPLFVMTSPATDTATRAYFQENRNLGLKDDELIVFCQGTMPAIDSAHGKILMDSKFSVALSPDGHGGIVAALERQGILTLAAGRGIDHFFYAQVDNPMVRACDPQLIGYHLLAQSEMTTQVVSKRFATEKVGNVVSIDGRTHIIEYSDLPENVATLTDASGALRLWAGNIAVHVLDRGFLASAAQDSATLPFHRALKAVAHVDAQGETVSPKQPNAIKFERFVFDLLPKAKRAIVVEGDPAEVFAPVKNADGAPTDTPAATRKALMHLHRRWLESAGVNVPETTKVEINPLWALDATEVRQKIHKPATLSVDTYFV